MSWTLETEDMQLTVEAGPHAPRIVWAAGRRGWNWASRGTDLLLPRRLAVGESHYPPEWTYRHAELERLPDGDRLTLTYKARKFDITLTSVWTSRPGPGPVQHGMAIGNRTGRSIMIYDPQSLDVEFSAGQDEAEVFYVSKDRLAPRVISFQNRIGTYLEALTDRYHADVWTTVDSDDTGYVPLVMLHAGKSHGLYVGWEWNEGRIHVAGRNRVDGLYAAVSAGMHGDFCTELPDGETFEVPNAFIGAFEGSLDDGSNRLRKWLFNHMMPEANRTNEHIPYVQWNAFWNTGEPAGSWNPVEAKYYPMVDSVAEVGIEEITIDVGWWQKPGDFRASEERWPQGMDAASRYAHDRGMLFTLYFAFLDGWSEHPLALSSKGPTGHPDWFVHRWVADVGIDECRDFLKNVLLQRLNEYDVDTFRSDLSPIARSKAKGNTHQGCHDGPYWAQKGFLHIVDHLLANKPGLRFQNCNCGGAFKGYALMKRSTAVQVTDIYTALDVRQAVWDSVYVLPLMQLLTQFGDVASGGKSASDSYRFRTYLIGAPSAHFELPSEMPPEEAATLKRLVGVYKERVRPLVRHADIYHVLPRPDGVNWDGLQLYDPVRGRGMLTVFRPDNEGPEIFVPLQGLDPSAYYDIDYDDASLPPARTLGSELMERGLRVHLAEKFSAEWVFYRLAGSGENEGEDEGAGKGGGANESDGE
ncbi:alpha-galactosidase [Paenibacillus sacheonensis]|uniref:Alpha-galactosidase n=1 Tax=Paenibacillus sacheonensis TaxID=742054 RepID=A0A7X4YQV8_9BACL|nr:alpha-galactosidase [Paenibacillus sacheonensis]MBM7567217.1 hypothetical protein [Paenibacillus sacheonensis]NBC70858.1 hypothetical protein [Paenibacillus sacheonensis]